MCRFPFPRPVLATAAAPALGGVELRNFAAHLGLIKRLEVDRYGRKFTPREPTSKWSDINRNRWKTLSEAGLLMPAGLVAAPSRNRYAPLPVVPDLPDYIEAALKTNSDAWAFFQQLARTYRRQMRRLDTHRQATRNPEETPR